MLIILEHESNNIDPIYEKLEQLTNNPHLKDNINRYNYGCKLANEEVFYNSKNDVIIKDETMLLMLQLGIPIGTVECFDEVGNFIDGETVEPVGEVVYKFKPLNTVNEYLDYKYNHNNYTDLMVHPDFLSKEKAGHLAYCLSFSNDLNIFDIETMNELQSETISSVPLEYNRAMEIFNKYYTKDICSIFINKYNVDINRFFALSGLDINKMNFRMDNKILTDKIKSISDLSFKAKNEKDSNIKENLEKDIKNILTDLKKQAISRFSSESDLKKFLDNMVNFNNYSLNNQYLIWLQKPDSKYVTSFNAFSKMGYYINKGEKGIKILFPVFLKFIKVDTNDSQFKIKPIYLLTEEELKKLKDKEDNSVTFYKEKATYFKVGNVFDVSQTTMPFEEIDSSLNPILEDSRADGITDIFIKAIYKDGIKVKYEDIDSGAKGYCDFDNKTIVVKKNLSDLMRLKVIIHEYAHSLAHTHLKDNNKEYQEHREQYESEAEAIAYVVSKYLGLDTKNYSITYLYSWSKNKDFKELDDSFETINRFSKKIIKNYEEIYDKELDLSDNNMNFVEI